MCLRGRRRPDLGSEHSLRAPGRSRFNWVLPYRGTPLETVAMVFRGCAGDSSSWHCEIGPRVPATGWVSPWTQWRTAAHPVAWQVEMLPFLARRPHFFSLQPEFTQVSKLG